MGKTSEMAERLSKKYNTVTSSVNVESVPVPAPSPKKETSTDPARRGRPKGSTTRKEEVRRVGFEAEVSLLNAFDSAAAKKGLSRREAFQEALRCFVRNK